MDLSDTDRTSHLRFNDVVRSGASVVEGDSILSDYNTPEEFDEEVRSIDFFAKQCHERNLKIVWYYPCLEVISNDGEKPGVRSLYKEYPDWAQVSVDRKPNVFYGSKEHWVDPFAESAWLCHNSGYREYFFERIRKLASTRLDGLWIDVPLFMDTVLRWVCFNPACIAKFHADTGLDAEPLKEDWTNPVWRKWVHWRHEELSRFCMETLAVARSVKPGFEIVFETVTMDTDIATVQGLDATFRTYELSKPMPSAAGLKLSERIDRVWELDSVSNSYGMRPATHDDWLCKIRGAKFARACDRPRPSWVFSYGAEEADAGLVMSLLVGTGCNPYETKTPQMTTTVGAEFRSRMFHWIGARAEALFEAKPVATVGLLHSSASRDFIDRGPVDTTFFTSAVNLVIGVDVYKADPSFFWGARLRDTRYCADYGGAFKALSHLHVPFEIVPLQTITAAEEAYLGSFKLLVAPHLDSISDLHVDMLQRYVQRGGHVLAFGTPLGHKDQFGDDRPEARRLDRLLGFDSAAAPVDAGTVRWVPAALGMAYLNDDKPENLTAFVEAADRADARLLKVSGDHKHVHMEVTKIGRSYLVHLVNYSGAASKIELKPALPGSEGPPPPPAKGPGAKTVAARLGPRGKSTSDGRDVLPRGVSSVPVFPYVHDYVIARRDVEFELAVPEAITKVTFHSPDRAFVAAEGKWLGGSKIVAPVHQYTLVVMET